MPEKEQHDRIVLLNTMLSYSTTRAQGADAPALGAFESLKVIEARMKKGWAVEFFGVPESDEDESEKEQTEEEAEKDRLKEGQGHDCVRLKAVRFDDADKADEDGFIYAILLIEALDRNAKSFPVVDIETFQGREINANRKERGSAAAHVAIRIPKNGVHDAGKYRCAIETVHPITRTEIETLLSRQLRRYAEANSLTFSIKTHKGGKPQTRNYRYTPKLQLVADVGRKLNVGAVGRVLSHMVFVKRAEKQSIGKGVAVSHKEVFAEVRWSIGASQGPSDPAEQRTWAQAWAESYRERDFEVFFYYRNPNGRIEGGSIDKAVASATDLLMCPRTQILLTKPPKKWVSTINAEIVDALKELLDRDELWERSKSSR